MNNKISLLPLFITLFLVSFTSANRNINGFKLENETYLTSFAYHENFGPDQIGLSGNIDIHLMSTPKDCLLGKFDYVTLSLNSPDLAALAEGIYTYEKPVNKTRSSYTFSDAYVIVHSKSKDSSEFLQSVTGEISVQRRGKQYEIKYSLQLEDGLSLSGSYSGLLEKW